MFAVHTLATDLGVLLMEHPENEHTGDLTFGRATLFYPKANEAWCRAALMAEVDMIELVRGSGSGSAPGLNY